ncbi:GTP-binding protein [Kitasatospora sp. RB6PN24]|uniref:GTP-binding protein n=1 Tax=Kitasatospora humi TaxID=2893891 RepID=UPI001E564CFF|nr:GTP-binding protein [Kitasatospora humi]MCC9310584.1 GTP-binding protein [Kitasatospora humi]
MNSGTGHGRNLLSVVCGNTTGISGRLVDLLLHGNRDTLALAVAVGAGSGRYPTVQRFVSGHDLPADLAVIRSATGDPAVIIRQDLAAISRALPGHHVVLVLPNSLETTPFLADLWRAPIGTTPLSRRYDLAPVTVAIDPRHFLRDLRCTHRTVTLRAGGDGTEAVTVAEAAARVVEAAGRLVVPVAPQADADGHRAACALLTHLNPFATLLRLPDLRDHRAAAEVRRALVDPHSRQAAPALADAFEPVRAPVRRPLLDHGISSVLWRTRRPLHPERLAGCLAEVTRSVTRSRGHLWLANRPGTVVTWRSAGRHLELRAAGDWLEDGAAEHWRHASPTRRTLASWYWDDYYGERRNEIVFTGADLDPVRLHAILNAVQLADHELALGPDCWRDLPDPLLGGPGQDQPAAP